MYLTVPIHWKRGVKRPTAASSPPAKMERVPLRAPLSPPETGASTEKQEAARAASYISAARVGSEVVMSTRKEPEESPEITPDSGSRAARRTSEG
ncbi:hypothetical protein M5K25_008118 [Dendrobium thyrsiflorum]|uniref:Uncharacterized protein n=1 Tax=Dendrobium thyrsiflorum TaxID=117978 RepID=A0ABD0V7U4_DENTH